MSFILFNDDCLERMPKLDENSIDSIVTDPPYGLSFMGKSWDHGVPGKSFWSEALRVAKPGAHLFAFGGTRTYHRLVCAIEDAGWEIRDCVMWVYGSGFPKSLNLKGKWQGWGTALKPAWEPIILARKPLVGTVSANVLMHGTGALNVEGCRVAAPEGIQTKGRLDSLHSDSNSLGKSWHGGVDESIRYGRWPANVIHDGSEEVVGLFPQAGGGFGVRGKGGQTYAGGKGFANTLGVTGQNVGYGDCGSAARFFYCAKASKADRDEGCEELEAIYRANGNKWTDQDYRITNGERPPSAESGPRHNFHPTVKPTSLMCYLCRLVTPPGGVILDPFMGSGSTGKAAMLERFQFIGIEMNAEYIEIAKARIGHAAKQMDFHFGKHGEFQRGLFDGPDDADCGISDSFD